MEWCKSECGKYRIESLTAATVSGALSVIAEAFCKEEFVSIATEINENTQASEEMLELCAYAALDGVSIVAVEISSGKVVSACLSAIHESSADSSEKTDFEVFAEECCTQPASKATVEFMTDRRFNVYDRYGVDCSFEQMFLGTLKEHRRRNLGFLLCKVALDIGRKLKEGPVSTITVEDLGPKYSHMKPRNVTRKIPTICRAINTSVGTQKITKYLGFTVHLRVSFTEFVYNGKTYVERVGFDPFCEVVACQLD